VTLPPSTGKGGPRVVTSVRPVRIVVGSEVRVTVDSTTRALPRLHLGPEHRADRAGEVGIPGLRHRHAAHPTVCEPGLLAIDGMPSTSRSADDGDRTRQRRSRDRLWQFGHGSHSARHHCSRPPLRDAGVDLDSLTLASAAGGGAPLTRPARFLRAQCRLPLPTCRCSPRTEAACGCRSPARGRRMARPRQSQNRAGTPHVDRRGARSRPHRRLCEGWYVPARLARAPPSSTRCSPAPRHVALLTRRRARHQLGSSSSTGHHLRPQSPRAAGGKVRATWPVRTAPRRSRWRPRRPRGAWRRHRQRRPTPPRERSSGRN